VTLQDSAHFETLSAHPDARAFLKRAESRKVRVLTLRLLPAQTASNTNNKNQKGSKCCPLFRVENRVRSDQSRLGFIATWGVIPTFETAPSERAEAPEAFHAKKSLGFHFTTLAGDHRSQSWLQRLPRRHARASGGGHGDVRLRLALQRAPLQGHGNNAWPDAFALQQVNGLSARSRPRKPVAIRMTCTFAFASPCKQGPVRFSFCSCRQAGQWASLTFSRPEYVFSLLLSRRISHACWACSDRTRGADEAIGRGVRAARCDCQVVS